MEQIICWNEIKMRCMAAGLEREESNELNYSLTLPNALAQLAHTDVCFRQEVFILTEPPFDWILFFSSHHSLMQVRATQPKVTRFNTLAIQSLRYSMRPVPGPLSLSRKENNICLSNCTVAPQSPHVLFSSVQ